MKKGKLEHIIHAIINIMIWITDKISGVEKNQIHRIDVSINNLYGERKAGSKKQTYWEWRRARFRFEMEIKKVILFMIFCVFAVMFGYRLLTENKNNSNKKVTSVQYEVSQLNDSFEVIQTRTDFTDIEIQLLEGCLYEYYHASNFEFGKISKATGQCYLIQVKRDNGINGTYYVYMMGEKKVIQYERKGKYSALQDSHYEKICNLF